MHRNVWTVALGLLFGVPAVAQPSPPGEGDCSSEFIYNFTSAQRCTETGKCQSWKTKVQAAALLTCGDPWGSIMRVCFAEGCVEGKATERRTSEGDLLISSIVNNPKSFGKYPKKFVTSMMLRRFDTPFPYQFVLFGGTPTPFTELAFGEYGSASFRGAGAKTQRGKLIDQKKLAPYLGKPELSGATE